MLLVAMIDMTSGLIGEGPRPLTLRVGRGLAQDKFNLINSLPWIIFKKLKKGSWMRMKF